MVTNIGNHEMEKNIRVKILNLMKSGQAGRQVEEIAESLGMTRHTVAKYLDILRAEGKVHFQKAGRTKIWKEMSTASSIRLLSMDDLDEILRIEKKIQEEHTPQMPDRMKFLRETALYHLQHGDPLLNLGADVDGVLQGFILAETRLWEFGRGEKTGWIKVLGVDPEYQNTGIGRKLGKTLFEHFDRLNVRKVRTLVDWYEGNLISYFRSLGFDILNMIPLEKELKK
ncbi:MAG: GNAT family N-acetyltransferase [Pseudomonadota bacterium]